VYRFGVHGVPDCWAVAAVADITVAGVALNVRGKGAGGCRRRASELVWWPIQVYSGHVVNAERGDQRGGQQVVRAESDVRVAAINYSQLVVYRRVPEAV
jgi:hypothetical protein